MLDVVQWGALVLYLVVFIYAGFVNYEVKKYLDPSHVKHLINTSLLAVKVQAGIYIALQYSWTLSGYSLSIGTPASSLWLGYEILSGVFMLAIISIVRIGMKGNCKRIP